MRGLAGPFGAGKATIEGRIEAIDALTRTVIATQSDDGAVRMGVFGGDFYGEVENPVENLGEDLAEDLAERSK